MKEDFKFNCLYEKENVFAVRMTNPIKKEIKEKKEFQIIRKLINKIMHQMRKVEKTLNGNVTFDKKSIR